MAPTARLAALAALALAWLGLGVESSQQLTEAPTCDGIFFATFNIQNYGVSKASKSAVMEALAIVISRYDLVTIQEISQLPDDTGVCGLHTESAICDLQVAVNARDDRSFALQISPRIGDEQYAVIYDSSKVSFLEGATYPDNGGTFSRPPYAFHLQVGSSSLAVASTHTKPDTATEEISLFPAVISWMEETFVADFYMVAGDYNADGSYFNEDTEWTAILNNIPNYTLLTGNELDTTLALSSNTYDRIIASSTLQASGAASFVMENHVDLSGVFQQGCQDSYINSDVCTASPVEWHEVAKELSDHYPVELCMHLNGTCSTCAAATTTSAPLKAESCAVVGYQADNPDDFGILLLDSIPAGFAVYVTDKGVLADGSLRSSEGILQFIGSEEVPPGTVLSIANFSSSSGTFSLSTSGDQILVFSGSEANPSFLCAVNFEGDGSWQSTADSASSSAIPPGLDSALALVEADNAAYVGNTTGTAEELVSRIQNSQNWQSDSSPVAIPQSFIVVPDPVTTTTSATTTTSVTATNTTTRSTATTTATSTTRSIATTTATTTTRSTATTTSTVLDTATSSSSATGTTAVSTTNWTSTTSTTSPPEILNSSTSAESPVAVGRGSSGAAQILVKLSLLLIICR